MASGLPPPVEREHIHTRQVMSRGYLRADGLWDIEASIEDTKTYFARNADGRERQPSEPIHHMQVRLTLDDTLTVIDAVVAMPATRGSAGIHVKPSRNRLKSLSPLTFSTLSSPDDRLLQPGSQPN